MSCSCALWRRLRRFRIIRKFALTIGTLLFRKVDLGHSPAAKFVVDEGDSSCDFKLLGILRRRNMIYVDVDHNAHVHERDCMYA